MVVKKAIKSHLTLVQHLTGGYFILMTTLFLSAHISQKDEGQKLGLGGIWTQEL